MWAAQKWDTRFIIWTQLTVQKLSEKTQPVRSMEPSNEALFPPHLQDRPACLNGSKIARLLLTRDYFSHILNQSNTVSRQLSISWSVFVRLLTLCPLVVTSKNGASISHSVPLRLHTLASKHLHSWWIWRQEWCGATAQRTESLQLAKENPHREHICD